MENQEVTQLEENEEFTLNTEQNQLENQDNNQLENQEEVLKPLVLEVLEDLGLTEIDLFKDELIFEEGLDLDTKEGTTEVIRRAINIGAKMFLEDKLKANPQLYQAFLHVEAGNSFDSFVNTENTVVSVDNLKNNITLQTSIYKEDLISKGIDEDIVDTIIKKAIDSETLFDKSKNIVEKRNEQLSETIKQKEEAVNKEREQQVQVTKVLSNITEGILATNDLFDGLLNVQPQKRQALYDTFLSNTVVEKGVAYYKIPLSDENIKRVIENHVINTEPKIRDKIYTVKLQQSEVKRKIGDTKKTNAPVVIETKKEEKISVDSLIR